MDLKAFVSKKPAKRLISLFMMVISKDGLYL